MKPLYNNLLVSVLPVLYIKTVLNSCEWARAKNWLSGDVTRKITHVAAGSWIIFWPWFDTDHWTWILNIIVPFAYSIELVNAAFSNDPSHQLVVTLTRTGNPTELLAGPILFVCIMQYCGTVWFMTEEGVVMMACLAFGDGIAPLIGKSYPILQYRTYPFGPGDYKSMGGSLAFIVSSMFGIWLLRHIVLGGDVDPQWIQMFQISVVGAMAEGISGWLDNATVSLAVQYALTHGKKTI
jgi:phytol kinase